MCFACHGKNLEGATGYNLKDAEWVYGSTHEQILKTIKNGFPEKGMIAFSTIYKDEQLKDVVNYILSKQEGLRNLNYDTYHGVTKSIPMRKIKWNGISPDKSGKAKPSYINYNLPEVDEFAMRFKGDLIIPESGNYTLSAVLRQNTHFEVLINNKKLDVKIKNRRFKMKMKLKNG